MWSIDYLIFIVPHVINWYKMKGVWHQIFTFIVVKVYIKRLV